MMQDKLFASIGHDAAEPSFHQEWSGDEPVSGDTIEVSAELVGARLCVLSWRKNRENGDRQETLKATFSPMRQGSQFWELLAARVNGMPCPLQEAEAVALFEAARAVARKPKTA